MGSTVERIRALRDATHGLREWSRVCECGNAKDYYAWSCKSCALLDGVRPGSTTAAVVAELRDACAPMTIREIANAIDEKYNTVQVILSRLLRQNRVKVCDIADTFRDGSNATAKYFVIAREGGLRC